jgi:hypothetical protein
MRAFFQIPEKPLGFLPEWFDMPLKIIFFLFQSNQRNEKYSCGSGPDGKQKAQGQNADAGCRKNPAEPRHRNLPPI